MQEIKKIQPKMFDVFVNILSGLTKESEYLIENMIENNLLEPNIVQYLKTPNFAHYMSDNEINQMIRDIDIRLQFAETLEFKSSIYVQCKRLKTFYKDKELSKNDWELHKKLIKEGHNPNELAKIIRNDEIEKLQEISSQTNFDFNKTIPKSLYERCSFINQEYVKLIDYSAFFGSIKCFKYLLMNGAKLENTGKNAIAGGNLEIFHLCEQNHSSFKGGYETAIEFHQNDIFKYMCELDGIVDLEKLGKKCVLYHNYEIFTFLIKKGMKINDNIINVSARLGNIYLVKYFLESNQIPKNILLCSVKSGNVEVVKYILEKGVNINDKNIYLFYLKFILIILYFKILFGNYFNYFKQHLSKHLEMVIQK